MSSPTDPIDQDEEQPPTAAPVQSNSVNIRVARSTLGLVERVRQILVRRATAGIGPDVGLDIQVPAGAIVEMVLAQWIAIAEKPQPPVPSEVTKSRKRR